MPKFYEGQIVFLTRVVGSWPFGSAAVVRRVYGDAGNPYYDLDMCLVEEHLVVAIWETALSATPTRPTWQSSTIVTQSEHMILTTSGIVEIALKPEIILITPPLIQP